MDEHQLKLLAKKYLQGEATPQEKELLNQWYDQIHHDTIESVTMQQPETGQDVKQRIFNQLHGELFEKPSLIRKLTHWLGPVAAVLALAFFANLWYHKPNATAIYPKTKTVSVAKNQIIHLTLADGSKVWLNKGAVFRYPKFFGGKSRVVELIEGRAFFDIAHQAEHPFIVKTKNLDVTVLGTSFDVSSYERTGLTKVSVLTGKVGVTCTAGNSKSTIMLLPKQQVTLNSSNPVLKGQPEQETELNAWCKNYFVFEQESLDNVFKTLEKEYHLRINVADKKLLEERVSITLNNQHLDSILNALSFTKHFKYQMANDSTVIIKQ